MDKGILRLAVCSETRSNILISLSEGKKSLGELRKELNTVSTTALHALRELEENGLVLEDKDRKYSLTEIGRIMALKLIDFSDAAEVLEKHKTFWLEHDLSGIPSHLFDKIGWLRESNIIQINMLDLIKTHSSYINLIKTAKWIKGVSPVFYSDYPIIFKELIEKNVGTDLILTYDVLGKLIDDVGLEDIKNAIHNYRLELLVTDINLRVAFTVTDSFLSLGLFTNSGVYDTAHDLTSTDDRAVRWGVELFEYYRGKAKKYEI